MSNEKCVGMLENYCRGACEQLEHYQLYNERVSLAIESLKERPSYIVFDKGLEEKQVSCIMVERGSILGMGYIAEINSQNVEAVKACLEPLKENAVIRQLLSRHVEQFSHKVYYLDK